MTYHPSLITPETIERNIQAQAPVRPLSLESRAFVLDTVIATHVQIWRYHYQLGNVISRRNQAKIISAKRAELRKMKAGL